MGGWTDDRIWGAMEAWRWFPPSSTRKVRDHYELAVTPGSYALTFAYGLHAPNGPAADAILTQLRNDVVSLGGKGVRVRLPDQTIPSDLPDRLLREGYKVVEETELLSWELRDGNSRPRLPEFRPVDGVSVNEVRTDGEFDAFLRLSTAIFGDPVPSAETLEGFRGEFHRKLREEGHTDRFIAWLGSEPIGRAGVEIVGEVARLWGTGVLPQYRGRGVYGVLVYARCQEAVRRGATLALVNARVGTSGPILKHHGFRAIGVLRVFEARW
jgi:GNAT superfamily N-acetyltransferase